MNLLPLGDYTFPYHTKLMLGGFLLLGRLHRLKTKEALLFKEPNDLFCERLLAHFIGGAKRLTATTHNETVDRFFLLALVPLSRCEIILLWV